MQLTENKRTEILASCYIPFPLPYMCFMAPAGPRPGCGSPHSGKALAVGDEIRLSHKFYIYRFVGL